MDKGEIIRSLRERNGMSQTELAAKLNTTKQTVYKYENNIVTNIPSDKIEAMARLFNVSPAVIMGWSDDTSADNRHNHGVIGDVSGGAVSIRNGDTTDVLSPLEKDMLRIFRKSTGKTQIKIMNFMYEIEESQSEI